MTTPTSITLNREAQEADARYTAALEATYGAKATHHRYRPSTQSTEIKALRDAYVAATEALHNYNKVQAIDGLVDVMVEHADGSLTIETKEIK